uniref:Uncharacterized protein n=1 Tax=Oryza punctata TaxID=4537 RepID=A0A0E0MHC3_ORYPU
MWHTFAVELCPVCRDDLVYHPKEACRNLGGLRHIVLARPYAMAIRPRSTRTGQGEEKVR